MLDFSLWSVLFGLGLYVPVFGRRIVDTRVGLLLRLTWLLVALGLGARWIGVSLLGVS